MWITILVLHVPRVLDEECGTAKGRRAAGQSPEVLVGMRLALDVVSCIRWLWSVRKLPFFEVGLGIQEILYGRGRDLRS